MQSEGINFSQNDLIFSFDQLEDEKKSEEFKEDDVLDKDDQYYFSRDQYFSSVKRGVVELDEKAFKIYTQALLHYKRTDLEVIYFVYIFLQNDDMYSDGMHVNSIYLNKSSLIQYVDKQFNTIVDQEIEQKVKAIDQLYISLTQQFPGFFVPKLSKRAGKLIQFGSVKDKREILKNYIKRLAEYQYLIQHPSFKQFIEKKMEIKKQLSDMGNGVEFNVIEVAERFREIFGYLLEVQIDDNDYKVIEQFDSFIRNKTIELQMLRKDLKILKAKYINEFRVEGKIYEKVTYQSFYYHLKTTAEVLGIKNKEFMNLQCTSEANKSFKDAIASLKKYVNVRNSLRLKMGKAVDHYNNYMTSKNSERRKRSFQEAGLIDDEDKVPAVKYKKVTVEKLEDEMEQLSYENAAYETICQVMIANMATFDIEKFKMHRQKAYYTLVENISRNIIEDLKTESRTLGYIWFTSVFIFWVYYSIWILISPFVDTDHPFQKIFPERKWGIVIPVLLGIGFLSIALTMIGIALLNDNKICDEATKKFEERSNSNSINKYRFKKFDMGNSSRGSLQQQSSDQTATK